MTPRAIRVADRLPREHGRIGRIEIAVFALFALGAAAWWFIAGRPQRFPNVVLISIDTLRPDHLGCYGYKNKRTGEITSRNLDALAARGVLFENAHSTTSWTLPAHHALLTGLPDELHAVRHDLILLDPNRKPLAERMTAAGYESVGFYGGPYLHEYFGFGKGFSRYENCGAPTPAYDLARKDPKAQIPQQFVANDELQSHRVRTADTITDRALDFVANRDPERPFFLFLHHWDCHYDYTAPERIAQRFTGWFQGDRAALASFLRSERIVPGMPADEFDYVLSSYDAEIAWVDEQIGRLLLKLEELGLDDDTYVVVVSDHGEEFFEHGEKGHRKNLHEESLRIPILVAGPGVRRGVRVAESVRIFDVMPTILELIDLPRDEIFGASLAPFVAGGSVPDYLRDLPILAELTAIPVGQPDPSDPSRRLPPDRYFDHHAVSRGAFKAITIDERQYDPSAPLGLDKPITSKAPDQLYNLAKDPFERENLATAKPQGVKTLARLAASLRRIMSEFNASLVSVANPQPRPLPPEIDKALRESGYLGPSEPDAKAEAPPAETPKEPEDAGQFR